MTKVFVNGTFDILHKGHLSLLNFARSHGDHVRVAVDSDQRVAKLKGIDRPVMDQNSRAELLLELKCVDEVFIFDTDQELIDLMRGYDVMVKGDDYQNSPIIGEDTGIKIVFYPRIANYSSTSIIERIKRIG